MKAHRIKLIINVLLVSLVTSLLAGCSERSEKSAAVETAYGTIKRTIPGIEKYFILEDLTSDGINKMCLNLKVKRIKLSSVVPYISNEEQSRIDFVNHNDLSPKTADLLIGKINEEVMGLDAVIINQQVLSGIHTPYFRKKLAEVVGLHPEKIFIADSRNYSHEYDGAYRKMNDYEASILVGFKKDPSDIVLLTN